MVKLSVVIPVYNVKPYLRAAVDSILSQPHKDIQVILVNDGSTDGSAALCDELSTEHDRVVAIHKANGGVSSARNTGIRYLVDQNTQGYVLFLDGDDCWTTNFWDEAVLRACEKQYDVMIFQSCCTDMEMKKRNEPVAMKEGEFSGGRESIWLYAGQHFGASLYSMTLFSHYQLRFDEKTRYSEDKIFILQALYLARKVLVTNKLLYLYRQNIHSAMHKRTRGISYYKPIVEAYLRSDEYTVKYQDDIRGETHAGTVMAGIYIMDMVDEHFQCFRSKKEIDALLTGTDVYQQVLKGTITKESYSVRYEQYEQHPLKYRLKNYVKGVTGCARQVIATVVKRCFSHCLYSVSIDSEK